MNKTVIGVVVILSVAALIGLFLYTESTRYEVVGVGRGGAYKVNRKTGETWLLVPQGQRKLPELAIK